MAGRYEQPGVSRIGGPRAHRPVPRASTIRLITLVGIAVALFGAEALKIDIFTDFRKADPPASRGFAYPGARELPPQGSSRFTLCSESRSPDCVIDGDTIRYRGVTIRLAGIDAPEVRDFKCAAELDLGRRATNRLRELMNAGPFQLVHRGGADEDKYGRKLRAIERNGRSLGDILVAEGLARRWDGGRRSWCGLS